MKKLDRVKAALRGEAVDRPPYGFWTHLPGIDLHPQRLAQETAAFASRYDLDFIKSMPNGLYCVEDWGCVCDYSEIEHGGVAKAIEAAVNVERDWDRLECVDVTRGSFGRELEHLASLIERAGPGVPVLATAFPPPHDRGQTFELDGRNRWVRDPARARVRDSTPGRRGNAALDDGADQSNYHIVAWVSAA